VKRLHTVLLRKALPMHASKFVRHNHNNNNNSNSNSNIDKRQHTKNAKETNKKKDKNEMMMMMTMMMMMVMMMMMATIGWRRPTAKAARIPHPKQTFPKQTNKQTSRKKVCFRGFETSSNRVCFEFPFSNLRFRKRFVWSPETYFFAGDTLVLGRKPVFSLSTAFRPNLG
jgi:hypothetical protein